MALTKRIWANNVRTSLAGAINSIALTLNVQAGAGATMPNPNNANGEYFDFTIEDQATGNRIEIVAVTAVTGDVLTIVRGQQGTAAQSWAAGDIGFIPVTKGALEGFVQPNQIQQTAFSSAEAAGSADAIIASFTPAITALTNGMLLMVRANSANTTTTPTFSPNGLTPVIIVKGNGLALAAADIAGTGHWIGLQYDIAQTRWVLLNPATGVTANNEFCPIGYSELGGFLGTSVSLLASDNGKWYFLEAGAIVTLPPPIINNSTFEFFCFTGSPVYKTNVGIIIYPDGSYLPTATNSSPMIDKATIKLRSNGSDWIVTSMTGGGQLIPAATAANNPVNLGQFNSLLAANIHPQATVVGLVSSFFSTSGGINNYGCIVLANEAVLENGSNLYMTVRAFSKTINSNGTVGAPLSIMSTRAASTWYYRWLWYNVANDLTATFDISSTAPTAPTGYVSTDYKCLLPGACKTDSSGSAYLLQMFTRGYETQYVVLSGSNVAALPKPIVGAYGNVNTPVWQEQSVSNFVPPNSSFLNGYLWQIPSSGGAAILAPNNQYGGNTSTTNPPPVVCNGSSNAAFSTPFSLLMESKNIYYAGTAGCGLSCLGWR